MAAPRSTLIRRQFRQRFGISAQRVGIQSKSRWYWRVLAWVMLVSAMAALAAWMHDAGRRSAGFQQAEAERELRDLREKIVALESRTSQAIDATRAAEGQLQIELATLQQLSAKERALQLENAALREDLALFDGLVSEGPQREPGIRVPRATLEAGAAGRLKYRVLILHQPAIKRAGDFSGTLQFHLTLQEGGGSVIIAIPSDDRSAPPEFSFSVKHLYRAEGELQVPQGAKVIAAELRLLQDGVVRLRQLIIL